jgi:hypothetical protein
VTGFQAKADDMPASEIEKEMRPKAKQADGTKAGRLRPSIRALAEAGAAPMRKTGQGQIRRSLWPALRPLAVGNRTTLGGRFC